MQHRPKILPFVLVFCLAFFYNAFLLGWDFLNPQALWLATKGDIACHYVSSIFFLNEPWHWPLGIIETQNIAAATSIGLTDSIPLVAFTLKLIGVGGGVQYFGIWYLLNIFLIGTFGVLWAKEYTPSPALQVLTAAFLMASPLILMRMLVHPALAAQWLIVAALFFYQKPWRITPWGVLVAIAALTHPYLLAMVLALAFFKAICAKKWWSIVFFALLAFVLLDLSGYFVGTALHGGGFGQNRARPYVFLMPKLVEHSLFPGLGILLLALVLICFYKKNKNNIQFFSKYSKGLGWCIFLMTLYAFLTSRFGRLWLVGDIFQMFRTNVRFGWPFVYFFMLFILVGIIQSFPKKTAIILLTIAFIWQISPFHPFSDIYGQFRLIMAERKQTTFPNADELKMLAKNNNTLILFSKKLESGDDYYDYVSDALPFAHFAANKKMQTNFLCQGHPDLKTATLFQEKEWQNLKKPHTLYVFLNDYKADFLKENLPSELAQNLIFFKNHTVLPAKKRFSTVNTKKISSLPWKKTTTPKYH